MTIDERLVLLQQSAEKRLRESTHSTAMSQHRAAQRRVDAARNKELADKARAMEPEKGEVES